MADVGFFERAADILEKVSGGVKVLWGALPGGRFAWTTENIRGNDMTVWKNMPGPFGDYFLPFFAEYADKEWLVYESPQGTEKFTYGQSAKIMHALGAELAASFDVQLGDRVGIAMRNLPEFLIAFFAITAMGGVAVPLNALWKTDELEYAVKGGSVYG